MVKFKNNKGSALLLTLIVMSIASVLIFSVSKTSLFLQIRQNSYESSIGAMYAAEAGYNIAKKASVAQTVLVLPNGAKVTYSNDGTTILSTGIYGKAVHQIQEVGGVKTIK